MLEGTEVRLSWVMLGLVESGVTYFEEEGVVHSPY